MELTVLSTSISEPVTVQDCKDYIGYSDSDQDAAIARMIQTAREWLEKRCSLSLVNKQYKAYFTKADAVNGWYELPVSPVLSTPDLVVSIMGTETTDYETKGLNVIKIKPYLLYSTVAIGSTTYTWYMEVTFNAGATNHIANEIIRKIAATMFLQREDGAGGEVLIGRLPYDTLRLIESINKNTGL